MNPAPACRGWVNPAPPKMYYVYLLKSVKNPTLVHKGWTYIGCTPDLIERLHKHRLGKCYSTRKYLPLHLVYYEAYSSKEEAYTRERKLKQYGSSLQKLKKRISKCLEGGAG
ncbi:MAG: GIY-YIG nuclease family protein [Candidatus Omnitrophica bacterium]|nr:GIY-YIG nuclease family protein [Candidatus Omnitrophota bacterium]